MSPPTSAPPPPRRFPGVVDDNSTRGGDAIAMSMPARRSSRTIAATTATARGHSESRPGRFSRLVLSDSSFARSADQVRLRACACVCGIEGRSGSTVCVCVLCVCSTSFALLVVASFDGSGCTPTERLTREQESIRRNRSQPLVRVPSAAAPMFHAAPVPVRASLRATAAISHSRRALPRAGMTTRPVTKGRKRCRSRQH